MRIFKYCIHCKKTIKKGDKVRLNLCEDCHTKLKNISKKQLYEKYKF